MQTTAVDVTWSYGAQQPLNLIIGSRAAILARLWLSTNRMSVRRLLFLTFADRQTMVSGILMAK